MPEETLVPRPCPKCGADLHPEASFCPYCAESLNPRTRLSPPRPGPRRFLRRLTAAAVLLLLSGLLLGLWRNQPQVLDQQGQLLWSGAGGDYQVLLSMGSDRTEPFFEVSQSGESGAPYRFPVRLYVNDAATGLDAQEAFREEVSQITAQFQPAWISGANLSCTPPEADHDYAPEALAVSYVDFTTEQNFSAQMVWTLQMKNGDTLRLRLDLLVTTTETYDIYPDDAPMETMEELQALVDRLSDQVPREDTVNLHLPAVTYTGELNIDQRAFNLFGTEEASRRTTFAGPVCFWPGADSQISYLENLDFRGDGSGIGLSASARVRATSCAFSGWEVGFSSAGTAWVNTIGCSYEDNQVGFRFNSSGRSVSHTMFNGNTFRNNGTGVLLESVPTDVTLNFQDSVFSGNGTDIENLCQQPLDLTLVTFE